jgi:hypothetical protein
MPTFTVLRRADAFFDYTTEVDAPTAREAAERARSLADTLVWRECSEHEYDAQAFIALDDKGNEIPVTESGDFV